MEVYKPLRLIFCFILSTAFIYCLLYTVVTNVCSLNDAKENPTSILPGS